MDVTGDYWALRHDVGCVWLPRDVLLVAGDDAEPFLQGQLSQDVAGMADGEGAWSFLLQPQGKVDAYLRVSRLPGGDGFVLDTDGGFGPAVIERLERFKLRTRATIEPVDWRCLAVRGPRTPDLAPLPDGAALSLDASEPGLPGRDLLGPDVAVPDGVRVCGAEAWEAVRVELGLPAMGRELTERTIPNETGMVPRAVSFTKGCFTGQELVARLDSRGSNTPRRLRGVVIETNVIPPVGAALLTGDAEVGRLTSVAESLDRRAPVALAYVRREVEPPAEALVRWDGGEAPARIEELPLLT